MFPYFCTSPVCYVDGDTGGGVIASSANCIDCDGVFSAGIQSGDGGSGVSAWDINLPRSLATWEGSKEGPSVKLVWLTLEETKNSKIKCTDLFLHRWSCSFSLR